MQAKGILFVFFFTGLLSFGACIQDEDDNHDNYVDVHQHPRTFSCAGKKSGEYYADQSTNCQLYFVCLPNAQLQLAATSFACPNTTRFNQATRVCSPADQVYCRIAERYYENVHGNIDSKGTAENHYLPEYFDKTPWQLNRKPGKSLIVPLPLEKEPNDYKVQPVERPRPAPRTVPKIETSAPKSDSPLHTSFALSFNQPQNPRVVARTRASTSTSNTRRGNALDLIQPAINQPSSNRFSRPSSANSNQNSRAPSRLPVYSAPGRVNQPPVIVTSPSTTTTTTPAPVLLPEANLPPKPSDPKSDYIYDYVYEDAPAGAQPASPATNNKPALPALPSLDDATTPNRNTNAVSTLNANLGALFGGGAIAQPAIGNQQQPPQLPKLSSPSGPQQRPPTRNQIPQSNGLNFFNSNNPFHSNPFASNPFSNSNSGSLIRQKRANEEDPRKADETEFSCHDKLIGAGYANLSTSCKSFLICLPLSKGKYKKYELFCDASFGYNQYTAQCEPLDKFDCKRSKDFYLYNKQVNMSSYMKNRFRISKQLADIKN